MSRLKQPPQCRLYKGFASYSLHVNTAHAAYVLIQVQNIKSCCIAPIPASWGSARFAGQERERSSASYQWLVAQEPALVRAPNTVHLSMPFLIPASILTHSFAHLMAYREKDNGGRENDGRGEREGETGEKERKKKEGRGETRRRGR